MAITPDGTGPAMEKRARREPHDARRSRHQSCESKAHVSPRDVRSGLPLSSPELAPHLGKRKLHATLASTGDAVAITDLDGRVTYLNPVAESLTGWTIKQAERTSLDEVLRLV